jgi:hypothetical protein
VATAGLQLVAQSTRGYRVVCEGRMVIEARQDPARLALRKAARQRKSDEELDRLAADARMDADQG